MVGSRDFRPLTRVESWILKLQEKHPSAIVVSGGAKGVDRAAETAASRCGLGIVSFRPYRYDSITGSPEWSIETITEGEHAQSIVVEAHRRISPPYFPSFARAAHARNSWIVETCDHLVAFWNGRSNGTLDTIRRAREVGKLAAVLPRGMDVVAALRIDLQATPV